MVLRGQPKDRDGFYSPSRELARQSNDRDGFVKCVSWSQKQSHLLAADNRTCSLAEVLDIAENLWSSIPRAILLEEYVGDALPTLDRDAYAASLMCEFIERACGSGIKRANLRITVKKVEIETRDTGHVTEGKTFLVQSGLSRSGSYYSGVWISAAS